MECGKSLKKQSKRIFSQPCSAQFFIQIFISTTRDFSSSRVRPKHAFGELSAALAQRRQPPEWLFPSTAGVRVLLPVATKKCSDPKSCEKVLHDRKCMLGSAAEHVRIASG